jgi:diguanylate cyclase (GGDEF)-like protein/PAS domain S-box-containing protein
LKLDTTSQGAERQTAILDALPAHIALVDADGIILAVNESWRRFATANDLQGSDFGVGQSYIVVCERARGDYSEQAHAAAIGIRRVLHGEARDFAIEYPCHSPMEQRWFHMVVTPVREDRPGRAVVTHVNITERKQAEKAAQLSQNGLRDLIDGLGPSMFVGLMTPQGILIEANRPALAAAGLKPEDVLGKGFAETYWWTHSEEVQQQLREAITRAARGEASRYDVQVRAAENHLIDVDFSLQPVRDETGQIAFLVPSASVITDRKRTENALRESNEKFQQLADNITDAFWIRSPDMRDVHYISPAFERIWGRSVESLYAKPQEWTRSIVPEDRERVLGVFAALMGKTRSVEIEYRIVRPDGEIRWVRVRGFQVRDVTGELIRLTGIVTDITERKQAEDELFGEKERAQVTLNSIGDAVVCTDISGNITFLNLVAEKMTGWSRQEAAGWPMSDVCRILDATTRKTTPNPMEMAVAQGQTVHVPSDCILIRRDGFEIPIEDSVAPIHDRKGHATGAVIVFRDVSAAQAMALQMTHSAQHDFLTGLPNRMLLNDRVGQAIVFAPRHMKKVAVLFLDLDGFKHINDSLGHPIGDKLLQSIAKRLVDCVRGADTVSRQGGDEFVVLLSEVEHPEDAAITARRLLQAVAEPHSIEPHDLHVTASIGVSVYPEDGLNAEALVKNADTAMYQAKENGRQSYQFFKPAMNVRAVERQSIEESLRRALERQEFVLYYQPKIHLRTREITGAEALIRWTHPSRGPVSPAQFIPVAEDCGLIVPIGRWVLREACKQARTWVDAGLPPSTMAVNISAMEFRDENFLESVFAILKETGLDPSSLELELTESVLMKRAESAASVLQTLRARGVQVAVDDFGTGYSSLSYLRKFPIDALKIDQSFIRQITSAPFDTTIVTAVISMARSMNLRVVAEGVETQEELAFLQAHECDEAQGYYFSHPVLPQQFAKLLQTGISDPVLQKKR